MILWATKRTTEKVPAIPSMGIRSWRWVLDVSDIGIALDEQMHYDNHWIRGNRYIMLSLDSNFKFGETHVYHDGPNCCINLGFLRLSYSLNSCDKCETIIDEIE